MFRIAKYIFTIFIGVCFCILLIAGHADAIKRGGTITVGVAWGPTGWDPHISTGTSSVEHLDPVYQSLIRLNPKMEMVPSLATAWDQPDLLTIIFHIRQGVKFHNGREMTVEDVKYSLDRIRDPKRSARPSVWAAIKSVTVLDKKTVEVKLSRVDVNLLPMMSQSKVSQIVPREVIDEHGDLKNVTCGTGPFKVKKYVPGDYTEYVRNPDYWEEGLPIVDRLIFKVIKDESSRLAALRQGVVDIAELEPATASMAKKVKILNMASSGAYSQLKFYLHHTHFPGNIKKLRQAISCAIDRQAVSDVITFGYGKATGCIPPVSTPFVMSQEEIWNLPYYKRDLKLAKKLMKEAGYPDGFEFEIFSCNRNAVWTPTMELVQANLKEVGINAKIKLIDWGVQLSRWRKGDFASMVMSGSFFPSPDRYVSQYWRTGAKSNYFGYSNPEVDKLLDESAQTLDVKRRIEIWRKLQYIMAEDVFCNLIFAYPMRIEFFNKRIKGYEYLIPFHRSYLRQAWIDK